MSDSKDSKDLKDKETTKTTGKEIDWQRHYNSAVNIINLYKTAVDLTCDHSSRVEEKFVEIMKFFNICTNCFVYDCVCSILRETPVQLFVKTLNASTITIDVTLNDTVQSLRLKIQKREGILCYESMRLIHNGKNLNDSEILWDCGLRNERTIHLMLRLSGS
jgi:hypothetical protein